MTPKSCDTMTFDWLVGENLKSLVVSRNQAEEKYTEYPIPHEIGSGGFRKIDLDIGLSVFRAIHNFNPSASGTLFPLAKIDVSFDEYFFQSQIVRGGRIIHKEHTAGIEIVYSPGNDLFRYSNSFSVTPILDTTTSTVMTCFTASERSLNTLIGNDAFIQLLNYTGLGRGDMVTVKPIDQLISDPLHNSLSNAYTGEIFKLYCQARCLDYLTGLLTFMDAKGCNPGRTATSRDRAWAIHNQLLHTNGKLPSMNELAKQHGCSARSLNSDFVAEFGEPIFSYITSRRLHEAHAAIQNTDIPLKVISIRLGYSHVNHFNTAFKKLFGYPPGKVRR